MPRRVHVITCDSGCARIEGAEKEKLEAEVADLLSGARSCPVMLLPPGRHIVALDVPDAEPSKPVQNVKQPPAMFSESLPEEPKPAATAPARPGRRAKPDASPAITPPLPLEGP